MRLPKKVKELSATLLVAVLSEVELLSVPRLLNEPEPTIRSTPKVNVDELLILKTPAVWLLKTPPLLKFRVMSARVNVLALSTVPVSSVPPRKDVAA